MEHLLGQVAPLALSWDQVVPLLLPLPIIVSANWRLVPPSGRDTLSTLARSFGHAIWALLAMTAVFCVLLGLLTLAGTLAGGSSAASRGAAAYAAVLIVTGTVAGTFVSRSGRQPISRLLPIDPDSPVDATALVLSVVLVGSQLASQVAGDVLAQQAQSGAALGPQDLVAQEVPFLLAAILGVGMFLRRPPRAALDRLGLVRPTAWQLVLALAAAGVFFAFGNGADFLGHVLTPATADKVSAANQRLFGRLGDPTGIATIAISAGVCEELLFRGAAQPRLGILWTALIFTAVHTQYGLSLDAAAVFVLAIGLGLLRRVANTSTTIVCHVAYNTLVGIGVGGPWLAPAIAVESVLLLTGAAALFTGRLGSLRTAH